MRRVLLAVLAGVLVLGACGGDDGDAVGSGSGGDLDPAAVEKVKASLVDAEDGFGLPDGEAQCVAEAVVTSFGADRTNEIDFEAETPAFTAEEASQAAEAFDTCLDLNKLITALFTEEFAVSDESKACLEGAIDENQARAFFEVVFNPDADADASAEVETDLDADFQECLSEDEYAEVFG